MVYGHVEIIFARMAPAQARLSWGIVFYIVEYRRVAVGRSWSRRRLCAVGASRRCGRVEPREDAVLVKRVAAPE